MNGITITGGTLTFQLDSMAVGASAERREQQRAAHHLRAALPEARTPIGVMRCWRDTAANRLQAEFTVTLHTGSTVPPAR